ncbi:MHYT domain-containing protein [Rhodovulum sp. DZ06]|uniref:MHYT domain-containing protein n=1 Tax=Rhodovulum sp. DZ06 TaxID=3425126 RepID=UPI003D33B2D4
MLSHEHDLLLVAASLAISLMAGFTGLSLTRGAAELSYERRRPVLAMAAVVMGGGIWSMHFVAMLGVKLEVQQHYDALTTAASALLAIALTWVALHTVHFGARTARRLVAGGLWLALGVAAMHYLGMAGMQVARPVYTPAGLGVAAASAAALCTGAIWLCYGGRGRVPMPLGAVGFGLAVCAVHFIAMAGTMFERGPDAAGAGMHLDNEVLAFGVTLFAFVISGAFLVVGVNVSGSGQRRRSPGAAALAAAPGVELWLGDGAEVQEAQEEAPAEPAPQARARARTQGR